MSVLTIIAGVLLALCCICVIVVVTVQNKSGSGLSGAIMGGDAAGFSDGRDNNAKLTKLTKVLAGALLVLTMALSLACMVK